MSDYAVQLLTKMLEIYSPSGHEEEISFFLAEEMEKLGFQVKRDNVGNVIGEIGNGSPVILLCGHMDTVPGFIPVQKRNNYLYGRGATDAKASLAAIIAASSIFVNKGESAKIIVAGVVDEEGTSKGVKNLLNDGVKADYAFFGEPSGVEKITIGYKGDLRLKITCKTGSGHSAAHWLFESAVERAIEIWREIQKIHFPVEKPRSHFYSVDSCLTKIEGGKGNSTVPSTCKIYVDFRIPPPLSTDQVFREVCKVVDNYQKAKPKVSVEVKIKDSVEPFETDSNSLPVRALLRAIREVRHKSALLMRKTGTGDMNIFGRATCIPVVTYGPGDPALSHTGNEHVDIQEFVDSIKVYRKAIHHLMRMHCDKNSR